MYLVGSEHPHRSGAQRAIEALIASRERLVTDAEAFQEILHRYSAIRRPAAIQPAFDALRAVVDEVFPVEESQVYAAKDLIAGHPGISPRDAIHVAVMKAHAVTRILSFDAGLDRIPGILRLP